MGSRAPGGPVIARVHTTALADCPILGRAWFVWFQGCPRRCPGCINPETLAWEGPHAVVDTATLAEQLPEAAEGVVLSGGEPFSQAAPAVELCQLLRQRRPGIPLLAYTGAKLETLLARPDPATLELVQQLDVLIDGDFQQEQPVSSTLVGSANQRVFALKPAGRALLRQARRGPKVQLVADLDTRRAHLVGTGLRAPEVAEVLNRLGRFGLRVQV